MGYKISGFTRREKIMNNKVGHLLLVISALAFPAFSSEESMVEVLEQFKNESSTIRQRALLDLNERRRKFSESLVKMISNSDTIDKKFGSPLHCLILISGNWAVSEATQALIEKIDYQLGRSSFPSGDKHPAYAYFPAAEALVKIGNADVFNRLLARLNSEDHKRVKIIIWTLCKSHGNNLTVMAIDKKIVDTKDEKKIERYQHARELVVNWETILDDIK
jgi:hypothetical protein